MDSPHTYPPYPLPEKPMSYGKKLLLLGVQCGVLMFGALIIWLMVYSRDENNRKVSRDIAEEWGDRVNINCPFISTGAADGKVTLTPTVFNCNAQVTTKSLHRNIYEAEVYTAHVTLSGAFNDERLAMLHEDVMIKLNIETGQIQMLSPLKFNGKSIEWNADSTYLYAYLPMEDLKGEGDFSTDFDIRGSWALNVRQTDNKSTINITGNARNPSFRGVTLPTDRFLSDGEFSARWVRNISQSGNSGWVGISFLVGVSSYQKVSRSMKYAFIIILLTYISVLFTEIIMKRTIPLTNYFLIGAALILFYSLLLSFSEHLSFGVSYLIAAVMTIGLITGYMWRMLRSAKVGLSMGAILTLLYGSCFILLSLATYALLLGSMILFAALAAMMYGSLQIKK